MVKPEQPSDTLNVDDGAIATQWINNLPGGTTVSCPCIDEAVHVDDTGDIVESFSADLLTGGGQSDPVAVDELCADGNLASGDAVLRGKMFNFKPEFLIDLSRHPSQQSFPSHLTISHGRRRIAWSVEIRNS